MSRNIEQYTKDYNEYFFEHTQLKYRRKKVLEISNKYKPKRVLEIGCGNDSIFNYYKDYECAVIVEPSADFVSKCSDDFYDNKKVNVVCDFFENTNLEEQKFDFVLIAGLLHEVEYPKVLLRCVLKSCDQNTIIHVSVPNNNSFHLVWAYCSGLIERLGVQTETSKILQQHSVFDLKSLHQMVIECGFDVIEEGGYFIKPFNHKKMQQCVDNCILDQQLLDGLYKMSSFFSEFCSEIFVNCVMRK